MKMQHLSLGLLLLGIITTSAVPSTQVTNTSNQPTPFLIYGEVFYENNTQVDAPRVVVTNLNTSRELVAENHSGENFYQVITTTSEIHPGDLLLISAEKDGRPVGSVNRTITMNESRAGVLIVDINRGLPDLRVIGIFPPQCIFDSRNNTVNATIANNGTTPAGGFNVSLAVNGDLFERARIESLNTGCTENLTFNWTPVERGNHTLTVTADSDGEIDESDEMNNATSVSVLVGAPDLTVTDISVKGYVLDPEYPDETVPVFEYPNNVTATILNRGRLSADAMVEFCSELNISSTPIIRFFTGYGNSSNDTITQPNASRTRVHFISVNPGAYSYVNICDEENNTVETIGNHRSDYWSNWVDGDTLRVHARIASTSDYISFVIDKYEYVFADASVSIAANKSVNITRVWHADPPRFTNETGTRYVMIPCYTLSVIADPADTLCELDKSNNTYRREARLYYPYDFTITNITFSPEHPREGDPVTIDAAMRNNGFRSIDARVAFYIDDSILAGESVYFRANKTEHVTAIWNALPDINHLRWEHNITVVVDPENEIEEQDEENNNLSRVMNITLPNLTITEITTDPEEPIIGDTIAVTATIRNDENRTANTTAWFCEENSSIRLTGSVNRPKSRVIEFDEVITHEDAIMMRAYCTIHGGVDASGGTLKVYLNDRQVLTCTGGNFNWSGWTSWTSGSTKMINITVKGDNVPDNDFHVDYSIDKYQAVFGNTSIVIPANESVNQSMNWRVTQKNPRLIVTTSNATNSTDVSVSGTDIAVQDLSISDDLLWDGDVVNITAVIANFGRMNASNITVAFYDVPLDAGNQTVLIAKRDIASLDAGESRDITVPWIASLKVGRDISYNHTIQVKTMPEDSYIEDNPENNTIYSNTIMVKRSRDFSPTDISFSMNNETLDPVNLSIGELLTINATIDATNLASCGGSVEVSCYLDNTLINITTVSFPAGNETVDAEFEWNVRAHGNHTITVIADPENNISEFNESNNASSQDIYIRASDITVTDLTFDPARPEEGEPVNITATVSNLGNKDASDVTVRFIDESFTDTEDVQIPLNAGDEKNVTVRWNATPAGEHIITAVIDPKNENLESDESNNELSRTLIVQGADLTVSDLRLEINGTEVKTSTVITAGRVVNISAVVKNIGIRPARNLDVSFCVNDMEIASRTNLSLNITESVNVSARWNATIGNHTIAVVADPEKRIHETNESNNTAVRDMWVEGADLLVTNISCLVIPPDGAAINDTGSVLYDTDTLLINATIANRGILSADNFSAHIFYETGGTGGFGKLKDECGTGSWIWINRTVDGAECVYVNIQDAINIKDNIKIYDCNGRLIACPEGDGWYYVDGDEANVYFQSKHGVGIRMSFYAGEIHRYDQLNILANQSNNLAVEQQVSTGDHAIRVFIDPENNVSENSEDNNYADHALVVYPARDFVVSNMQIFHNESPIDLNDTIMDGDTVLANATLRMDINESDPYHEYRTGVVDLLSINEHEWVSITPRSVLTPYGYAKMITYPGADAIRVHFDELTLPWAGCVEIRNSSGAVEWTRCWKSKDKFDHNSSWVEGDTIYVYKVEKPTASTPVWGRTTFSIDKYQYRKLNHTRVLLGAGSTRKITTLWDVSAGNHTLQVLTDAEDVVGEINESNNEISRKLQVEACEDPGVLNITFTPQKPGAGSDVLINTTITNFGNRTANFTVDLWAEKIEYHPFESPHDEEFPVGGKYTWEIPSTYPDADWMGIHFKKISMSQRVGETTIKRNLYVWDENDTIVDNFCGSEESDVWVWVRGDRVKLRTTKCDMFPGYHVWGFNITEHGYRIILNHTILTLAPNETATVTGRLSNVRAGNHSMNYTIYASLDMNNTVYEMNESNNEMVRVLNISMPDFTVDIHPPTAYSGIRAAFRNIGSGSTSARILFSRDVDYSVRKSGSWYTVVPEDPIQDDIDWTRLHFKELNIRAGGYMEVGGRRYEESESDFWSPWVAGDRARVKYLRTSFEIDRYEFGEEDFIDDFDADSRVYREVPWDEYTEPYNITVWIDPFYEISEGNEDNNNETARVCADLVAEKIDFVSPAKNKMSLDAERFIIDGCIRNGAAGGGIVFPVSDFNVTLDVMKRHPNGTLGESVFNITKEVEDPVYAGEKKIRFEFDPEDKFESGGNYTIRLIADSTDDVCESDEENNLISVNIFVYNSSGYTGGGDLIPAAHGEVHGRVVYTIGDSSLLSLEPGSEGVVKYPDFIPSTADEIELARLFVYWYTSHKDPVRPGCYLPEMADVDVRFNGHSLTMAGNYSDNPGATDFDLGYGLYSYDVKDHFRDGENEASITNKADWRTGVHAIGLLVVYEDEDEPLTKYWVNEGADIMMAANARYPTGLPSGDCVTRASFEGVERNDTENVCASLLTVLGMYRSYDRSDLFSNEGDALEFNDQSIGSRIGTGHWVYHYNGSGIALTKNQWEDVADHLKRGDNIATIRSLGNYMMPNNAFLRLIFPPDLNVINMTAPEYTPIGIEHSIDATIRNDGRSDAHDFNVTFYIDGMKMRRIPHLDLPAGESMTLHLYNWTPMLPGHVYNLTAAADLLSGEDWREVEINNNALSQYVIITEGGWGNESGPVGSGGKSERTGGIFTERITGRVMNKIISAALGGGGGAGIFSMREWILKLGMLALCALTFGVGYWREQRRHNRRM
ncbi:hypothetical protein FHEFKHOI_01525 [Candidatus Methanoperedenaceae archaeon GB50]|nr:hypothetical protein FHEFKHOI_01525 [Candidatus Methanoperedenaceae archaeon GB50]